MVLLFLCVQFILVFLVFLNELLFEIVAVLEVVNTVGVSFAHEAGIDEMKDDPSEILRLGHAPVFEDRFRHGSVL